MEGAGDTQRIVTYKGTEIVSNWKVKDNGTIPLTPQGKLFPIKNYVLKVSVEERLCEERLKKILGVLVLTLSRSVVSDSLRPQGL